MNIFRRFGSWLSRAMDSHAFGAFLMGAMGARRRAQPGRVLNAYSVAPSIARVVAAISEDVSAVPWRLYKARSAPEANQVRSALRDLDQGQWNRSIQGYLQDATLEEVPRHPFLDFLNGRYFGLGFADRVGLIQTYLDLVGEAFVWINERNRLSQPSSMVVLPPTAVDATEDGGLEVEWLGEQQRVSAGDMYRVYIPDPANPFKALGLGAVLQSEIQGDEHAADVLVARYRNSVDAQTFVGLPGMKQEELNRIETKFRQNHSGPNKAGGTFFLGTQVAVNRNTQSLSDMSTAEQRRFYWDVICETFCVPKERVGQSSSSNKASAREAPYLMGKNVVTPRLRRHGDLLAQLLVPFEDSGKYVLLHDSAIPEDRQLVVETMKELPHSFRVDEVRRVVGMAPWGGEYGNAVYKVPGAEIVTAESVLNQTNDDKKEEKALAAPLARAESTDEIEKLVSAIVSAPMFDRLAPVWRRRLRAHMVAEIKKAKGKVPPTLDKLIEQHLRYFAGGKIKGITETSRKLVTNALREALKDGRVSIPEFRKAVSKAIGVNGHRATTIARTEVIGSANWGTWQAHKIAGVTHRKWIATPDERTRGPHRHLHGQVVEIDKPFEADGHTAMHPHGFGVPHLDIQCRCTTGAVIEDRGIEEDYAAFDEMARAWESVAEPYIRTAMADQVAAVVEIYMS